MNAEESIFSAVMTVFRAQKFLADHGKERFGDWNSKLAKAIVGFIAASAVNGAKKGKGSDIGDDLAAFAKQRALDSARQINTTTSEWLEEGSDKDPFSIQRAQLIAAFESKHARQFGYTIALQRRKKRLRWRLKQRKTNCPECISLNGKTVRAGTEFVSKTGQRAYHPPLHLHCDCTVEEI